MSVAWTEEQQKVIQLKNRNILVSAAAGSGKTAVLVERIIKILTDRENPVDVDRLLIVTFTEAAASEMKERIRDAIERQLMSEPDNEHLKQQETLIHNARITTIHSFCLSVIREHFHTIDLDPGFRIGEEGELKLLRHDVLKEVLEEYYAKGDASFLDFIESYAGGRDDKKVEELVLKLYEFSRSYPSSAKWLTDCIESYQISDSRGLAESSYFKAVKENVERWICSALELADMGLEIAGEPDGPYMYGDALAADKRILENLHSVDSYQGFCEAFRGVKWTRLATNRDQSVSMEKTDQVKALREEIKGIVKELGAQYFSQPEEEVLKDIAVCRPMMEVLVNLTMSFTRNFEEKKKSRNMIDFDDMEQYALKILNDDTPEGLVPSRAAKEYQEQFLEVMIDEYQDSNLIQEAILTSVSRVSAGQYNIFMVGDVKQSIYRFRLSRPELFMEKFDTYDLEDSEKQRIDLYKNFRSRKEVLDSVNFLFRQIMVRELGGITYDNKAALYPGADYEEAPGNETQILIVEEEGARESGLTVRELEARAIAGCIKNLMKNQQVKDKKTGALRPVKYSDIVILTRSIKGWSDVFLNVLLNEGIPVFAGTKEGYFETREIGILLDYLRVLNNRQQDIPLAAVLASYFGGLDEEELALIRSARPGEPFHQAAILYAKEGRPKKEESGTNETDKEKAARLKLEQCFLTLSKFDKMVPYMSIHELLWHILEETGYGDYVAAMPGGEQRRANVNMLVEKAIAFESTSYKGLFNFIRYIEQLRKYDVDYGEAALNDENSDTVRIMSIHKSKGLEFPVVIAAGMGKRFNQQDARGSVLIHSSLGVGLDAVDLEMRTKSPSFPKQVIQKEEVLESLGEELRVLYVALTRAREKLIITGTLKNAEEKLQSYDIVKRQKKQELSFGRLTRVSSYWDWILPALARRDNEPGLPVNVKVAGIGDIYEEELLEEVSGIFTKKALECWDVDKVYDEQMKQSLEKQFTYRYPYENLENTKLKFTVSELKKREYMGEESGEILYEEPEVIPLIPNFLKEQEETAGAARGSAYHRVLELLDFTRDYSEESLKITIEDMVQSGRIGENAAGTVKPYDILRFMESESGQRMKKAAGKALLWKEQPFVLGVGMQEIYPGTEGDETILIQGIIDVFFEEDGSLIVLDYKTDKVTSAEQLKEKYHAQLEYYARALERLMGKKVAGKIIYSFTLGEEIEV